MRRTIRQIAHYLRAVVRIARPSSRSKYLKFYLESPLQQIQSEPSVVIRGWLVLAPGVQLKAARTKNKGQYYKLRTGLPRKDVQAALTEFDSRLTLRSGFEAEVSYQDGELAIQFDFGSGFETLRVVNVTYSPEKLYASYFNPRLAEYMAEHQTLLQNKKAYYYEPEQAGDFKRHAADPRLIAFYLPQFHPIRQNDEAWGKGFTEWTNTSSAQPRFVGHQQPMLPADLGFYDLRLPIVMQQQIDLAKKYGIFGFCFYYYWFSGERVLEQPLDAFLANKKLNFPFMICWANENWTRRWDGRDHDVIIKQQHMPNDPLQFIKDVEPLLLDPRYIRQNGKPLLAVYRGSELIDPKAYVTVWRDYFRKQHGLELEIVSMMNFDPDDPRPLGFDAGIEFAPLTDYRDMHFDKQRSRVVGNKKLLDVDFDGQVADYRAFSLATRPPRKFAFPTYRSLAPSWDNEARKKGKKSLTLYGSNPDLYGEWLDTTLGELAASHDTSPIFINAWNEWAEGTTLEPTVHGGHALLRRTRQVLSRYSTNSSNVKQFPLYDVVPTSKTAVVVHIYYADEWDYISHRLSALDNTSHDLFITLTMRNKNLTESIRKTHPEAHVTLVPNRGRDVLPFMFTVNRLEQLGYVYVLKLHTKRSTHRDDGMRWFTSLVDALLANPQHVTEIIAALEAGTGMVGPAGHYISLSRYIGSNKPFLTRFVQQQYDKNTAEQLLIKSYGFFAGTMFWCRLDAIKPLLGQRFIPEDFEPERGQIDGTVAHGLERLLTLVPALDHAKIAATNGRVIVTLKTDDIQSSYTYADTNKTK